MSSILKILPAVLFWGIFIYVMLKVAYPASLTQADLYQLLTFFIPLFLAITFTVNLFLKNIFLSSSMGLGIILMLFLKALDALNFVSGGLIIISLALLLSYFKKVKNKDGLTISSKIPKLTSLRRKKS